MRLRPPDDPAVPSGAGRAAQPVVAPAAAAAQAAAPRPSRRERWTATARAAAPRSGVAAALGLAMAAAFPPYGVWPLSLVAVAGFALVLRDRTVRQGAWLGFAFAFPFFLWLLVWLRSVIWIAVVVLSGVEALYLVLMAALMVLVQRLRAWPLWCACLWVTQELVRDRLPFGGFPWGRLAFANTASPFTPLAALGGAPLVSFGVALSGTLLAAALLRAHRLYRRTDPRTLRAVLTGAGALVLSAAVFCAGLFVPVHTNADGHVRIAVVQGNVQQPGMHFLGRPMKILDNHVQATLKLAADIKAGRVPKPDIVLWPENSSDLDPFTYPQAYDKITEAVQAVGVPVLVGALVDGPDKDHVQNEGIVWDPVTGPGAHYTKQHPVPFGEYVPFRKQLTKIVPMLNEIPRDFYPGKTTGVMQIGPARLGDVICFEVAYDGIVRDTVNAGARAIVVQTNNATYGRTGQPEQQLAMSRLRAVEHGRAVVTAATSGISAIVAPDGKIEQRSKEFTQQVISADIPLRDEKTLADRVGAAPEWTLAMVGLLSCAAAVAIGRFERTRTAKGQTQQ
ncbi:apolipoprotein N-acyltransferase [Actinacidiphila guanduensis]|uniref:Apolipoprotein N-acyltransferase n=1 Tax=Actinacidiphila guanduensis TaxID=310781 RepID=A0A1H0Q9X3_9ACTN|nr:apolipoprotein N-acyltransferase [Actinacidiphila guanduensis]SDP14114.1 apolipoprotein N-acyltransferase [Actinacidiphila guanduensis]